MYVCAKFIRDSTSENLLEERELAAESEEEGGGTD